MDISMARNIGWGWCEGKLSKYNVFDMQSQYFIITLHCSCSFLRTLSLLRTTEVNPISSFRLTFDTGNNRTLRGHPEMNHRIRVFKKQECNAMQYIHRATFTFV